MTKTLPLLLCLLLLAGCGSGSAAEKAENRSERLVDYTQDPPWVTALDLDPGTGDLLMGTNKGFWRIDPESGDLQRIQGTIAAEGKSDSVGSFLEVEPIDGEHWIGSGHPDSENTLPQYLGAIETRDAGKTWKVISRLGEADLHKIVQAHGKLYAFDAVLAAILISEDGGKTFDERFTPRGLIADFVVDPEDPDYILAATDDQLFRTEDGGERWRPVTGAPGMRMAWPEPGRIVRGDADGQVYESTDRGESWAQIGQIDDAAYKIETTDDPRHLFLATADGSILETTDGGRTWKEIFTP